MRSPSGNVKHIVCATSDACGVARTRQRSASRSTENVPRARLSSARPTGALRDVPTAPSTFAVKLPSSAIGPKAVLMSLAPSTYATAFVLESAKVTQCHSDVAAIGVAARTCWKLPGERTTSLYVIPPAPSDTRTDSVRLELASDSMLASEHADMRSALA